MPQRFKAVPSLRTKAILPVLAACIAFGFGADGVFPLNAQAPATGQHTWKVYTNVRFQYSICYPQDLLVPQGEAENSDGQKFVAKDGAKLIVFGQNNALNESLKDALEDTASRLAGASGKVTYKAIKPEWFVASGENGLSIFYAKTLYARGQFKSFELTYGSTASTVYKPVITRLAGCFLNTGR
jgi:hypothetical protein